MIDVDGIEPDFLRGSLDADSEARVIAALSSGSASDFISAVAALPLPEQILTVSLFAYAPPAIRVGASAVINGLVAHKAPGVRSLLVFLRRKLAPKGGLDEKQREWRKTFMLAVFDEGIELFKQHGWDDSALRKLRAMESE